MLLTSGERVRRLQEQCEARIEHLVRKTTSLAKVIFQYLHNIYTISTISTQYLQYLPTSRTRCAAPW